MSFHAVEGHELESMIKVAILKRRTMFMPMLMPMLMFMLILTQIKIMILFQNFCLQLHGNCIFYNIKWRKK